MAAATASTVYSTSPHAGIDLGSKSSTAPMLIRTRVFASDGTEYMLVKASEAIGSVETVKIGASGSASSDSGSAGWTANVPGGATANQFFWCKRTSINS